MNSEHLNIFIEQDSLLAILQVIKLPRDIQENILEKIINDIMRQDIIDAVQDLLIEERDEFIYDYLSE